MATNFGASKDGDFSGNKFHACFKNLASVIAAEQKRMKDWEKKAQEREDAWETVCERFNSSLLGEPIAFNVGGKKFSTSLNSLLRFPDSYFSQMMRGMKDVQLTKDGSVFIDRSPIVFAYLLEFLRDPDNFANLSAFLTPRERWYLEQDCEFYAIPNALQHLLHIPSNGVK